MPTLGTLVTSLIHGLKCAQLHLMCEHIDGIHDVKDQEGMCTIASNVWTHWWNSWCEGPRGVWGDACKWKISKSVTTSW
jgi:hypothetical protein